MEQHLHAITFPDNQPTGLFFIYPISPVQFALALLRGSLDLSGKGLVFRTSQ
jgi:hypothetical protein